MDENDKKDNIFLRKFAKLDLSNYIIPFIMLEGFIDGLNEANQKENVDALKHDEKYELMEE